MIVVGVRLTEGSCCVLTLSRHRPLFNLTFMKGGLAVAKNKFWYCHVNLSYKQGPVCLSNHFTVIQILSRIILIPVVIKAHQPVLLYKDATREVVGIVFEARP